MNDPLDSHRDVTNDNRGAIAWRVGLGLIVCGLLHLAWGLWQAADWEGPLAYRKPALFGISFGVTLCSIGWFWPKLAPSAGDAPSEWLMAIGMAGEVGLIALQYWRGQPSHFNQDGWANGAIESAMTALVTVVSVILVWLTWRAQAFLHAAADVAWAIRGGLWFLFVSCAIGYGIAAIGHHQAAFGGNPEVYGPAGVLKFPHGVAIHALQVLPLLAVGLRRCGVQEASRVRWVQAAIVVHALLLVYSLWQTAHGRGRWELG
jgi:hypothetical protein